MTDHELDKILELAIDRNASDIHFQTGKKPVLRIDGALFSVDKAPVFKWKGEASEFKRYMNQRQYNEYLEQGSADFAFGHSDDYRFRGNVYRQQMGISMSLRVIRNRVLNFDELGLPPVFRQIAEEYRQGFFLVVGPTGHGKSTSLAAMLNHINQTREAHIITIEDPIEYIIPNDQCVVEQREIGLHASSFQSALRASMRQDPDIIMIGEMRDQETMETAMTLAETGHLVFSTLHTNNSAQTIDRIIDVFPEEKQKQVRTQLANVLTGVVSQRLIPATKGGMAFAYEALLMTDAVRTVIRSGKTEQIYNAIQGAKGGNIRLEQSLANLLKEGAISKENAMFYASSTELMDFFLED